jgi:hypothetical protein
MEPAPKSKYRVVVTVAVLIAVIGVAAFFVIRLYYRNRPLSITGAVIQQNEDTRKQSPIADVEVSDTDAQGRTAVASNSSGFFKLTLRQGLRRGEPITLHFRHPKYHPFELNTVIGDTIYVVHMVPLHTGSDDTVDSQPPVVVTNIVIRYSIETSADTNIGTSVTTFQVFNTGDLPCEPPLGPCSSDGKWKASIGSGSMDAGQGNVYRNARVFCIAGPCPFTKIVSDNFTQGGRNISVSVLDWSDTTTFLFQAEVFRQQVSDMVRESYPVIYGRTFNFSLPASAEGPSLEAELDRTLITFPIGPDPKLSWASCSVVVGSRYSKSYRCELKTGYKFP